MEPATARNTNSKFDCPLLHTPQHVQTKIRKYACGQETSITVVKIYKQFIQKRDERAVKTLGYVAEYSK
jgi:hypothetical protein